MLPGAPTPRDPPAWTHQGGLAVAGPGLPLYPRLSCCTGTAPVSEGREQEDGRKRTGGGVVCRRPPHGPSLTHEMLAGGQRWAAVGLPTNTSLPPYTLGIGRPAHLHLVK